VRHLLILTLLCLLPISASARTNDVIETVNTLRTQGCGMHKGGATALRVAAHLDAAAQRLADGAALARAIDGAGYQARSATAIYIRTGAADGELRPVLTKRYCDELSDATFTEIGLTQRGSETWIVLAAPFVPPSPNDAAEVQQRVLALVNAARAAGRRCGNKRFDAAPPLARSAALEQAALVQARDLAKRGSLGHRGSDGSEPADRVTRTGYAWSAVAENVAAGAATAQEVVAGWLSSPSHCANLMNPQFTEMGVAYALTQRGHGRIYWAQVFGVPRT
jgi:uncharacterized protein YkwD